MSKPSIKQTLTGYEFEWPEQVRVNVSRVQVHSDGRVTGELLITTTREGYSPVLYPQSQINFSSSQTRKGLAKSLTEDYKDWEWSQIIDQISYNVQELARAGEPVQELWTSDDVPPLEFLIEPFLVKGVPTVLFGEKGSTKSTMSLYLYTCLMLPWNDNPLGLKVPNRSVKTLILDYELPGYIAQRNAKKMQEGMGIPPFPLYHRRCTKPLYDELEQVQNHIANLKAEVVIIDSLARASGGDLNKTEGANSFFESLDKLNVTSLIIAQTSKDVESKRKTIYGNALFTYYARSIFEICRTDNVGENEIEVAIFHRWSNLTKLYPDMGVHVSFNGVGTKIQSQSVSVAEFKDKVNSQRAVYDELKSGAHTVSELCDLTGLSNNVVSISLSRLKKRNYVTHLENGKWGLATSEQF